ncbi:GSCFA domain-containing protein [Flavobacterium sp. GT3R68]|uniref:GSCFA domain-containing protein n=1 Tax=Flavobacterium sp. GT3R68 TaxID=2594437 RepID=UPI000F860AD8|nr:GSCFA domain-containing protein [Flavobacterium sp. GT3R68]RTY90230.1 GSCFA domain-containing protein [Flavobacterium sp. GSN2]TRW90531.1 GSCFA domain-containing protein [Flavobacterium sp. GT3R68]
MQFRTQIPIPKSNSPIDYTSRIVSLGSCFAVNMAEQFTYFKFQNTSNPFGILFHSQAIEKLIDFAVSEKQFTSEDIFFHNERWHSFDAHSDLSCTDASELLHNMNAKVKSLQQELLQSTHIIVTLGTAWVYRNKESNTIVANCHKVPQKQFDKELLSVAVITKSLENIIASIASVNTNTKIIFTVSPVRHIKDGFVENQISKSHLITAIHQVLKSKSANLSYFPSYEIMMDELRDYRFYAEDMIHPNQIAIDYIWERFAATWISEAAYKTMEEVNVIQKGMAHRPFNPQSESHRKFEAQLTEKKGKLVSQYPFMKF